MDSKVIYSELNTTIEHSTGEIHQTEIKEVIKYPREPPYIKLYINDLCNLIKIPPVEKVTLVALLRKLDYEGYITLSSRYRLELCQQLGIQRKTLRNRITNLVKKNFLARTSGSEYMINPNYFAKGAWREVIEQRKSFSMIVTYNKDGKRSIKMESK